MHFTVPTARLMHRAGISADMLTVLGFLGNIAAAVLLARGSLVPGGIAVLAAGSCDLFDGEVARISGRAGPAGAFLDSVLDRLSEAALLLGLLLLYLFRPEAPEVILIFVVLVGSLMVSYMRARAEGLGIKGEVGIFTRPERVVILALGFLTKQVLIALIVVAVLTWFTALQRFVYVRKETTKNTKDTD